MSRDMAGVVGHRRPVRKAIVSPRAMWYRRPMLTWKDLCDDPRLAGLPYKIELSGTERIIMSPQRSKHSVLQGRISALLNELMSGGEAFPECPLDTDDNTKVVDVVWASTAMVQKFVEELSWPEAPQICIEVASPSHSARISKVFRCPISHAMPTSAKGTCSCLPGSADRSPGAIPSRP